MLIHNSLNFECYGTCAFVKNRILGFVVEQTRHSDSLLVATTQRITPFTLHIPAAFSFDDIIDLKELENIDQVFILDALGMHLIDRVWVNDLITQRTER